MLVDHRIALCDQGGVGSILCRLTSDMGGMKIGIVIRPAQIDSLRVFNEPILGMSTDLEATQAADTIAGQENAGAPLLAHRAALGGGDIFDLGLAHNFPASYKAITPPSPNASAMLVETGIRRARPLATSSAVSLRGSQSRQ
ncbi:MAG TPA: hypothetical protein DEQ40_02620 [Oxalobacteraceae bacterium]|nr:hypothetical protein [Oxalobacteraceae bacterium]